MSDGPLTAMPSLEDMFCFDVYALQHALSEVYKPLLAPIGLTYPQYLVMVILWDVRQASVGEIGRKLDLGTNTLTPLLKRIEKIGFLTRRRDPEDERRVLVSLTQKGQALAEKARAIPTCVVQATGLSEPDILRFQSALRAVRHALDVCGQPAVPTDQRTNGPTLLL